MAVTISPLAVVEEGAQLGVDVEIAPFAYVSSKAKIGDRTTIGQCARIDGDTTIGSDCRIFSHAVVGSIPQDLKFHGEDVRLIIGDRNTIREFTLLNPGTEGGGGMTKIGDDNLLMGYVHVAHDCRIGDRCIFANAATLAGHVEVGNGVVVGGMTPIHQFVKIGDLAMIAGASALSQDVPPFCLAEGNRAVLRGLNLTGLRRALSREAINPLRIAYKELFERGKPLKETAQKLLETSESEEVKKLCRFVLETKRGIPYERTMND
ncbi:acyl-ACP--UDP-N-acetylglucosamine O-acyltransferase [Hydrogenimonas cancrithermarum]|uniref:Acyl-[acyl-carrier-protein]--UDP-N-acetylglucosamine O-acyltransferase n=1 Tax=Hydrogenimonas cancrithermarum TaxID=2993563 RepID=A0ABN6WZF6_9BACT|nr:acyl-ACP--UDP-N-acetylglucosamine O-acyltransferase [Hydrogenimonas cancrithermarum]BDY13755.1 acyl-[acyl-carrier-protein]--UDP-N-acetylglucosamine O-acyltransferase [Hydrogenimonas cancrithermarum]